MIIKILQRSDSFRGSWLYHFHDKKTVGGIKTSDRVGLHGLRNLGTDDPEEAFRQMALTWYGAADLKKKAGIRATGRKCTKPLITMVISYNSGYSPDAAEIERDIESALHLTGLTENQAIWVVHNDTANDHVHLMVNAVHPETGRAVSFDEKVAASLQAWARDKERHIGIQCHGRENPAQKTLSRKFIPAAERRTRERVADRPDLLALADDLAAEIMQEWKDLRHREQQENAAVYNRMRLIREQAQSYRKAIKATTASRIRGLYKRRRNPFFLTEAWFEKNEWSRLGRRIYAARRLFYQRERSLSGMLINAIHMALSDFPEKKDFTSYLLSREERRAALESWINQEYSTLKQHQKEKKTVKRERLRAAEHQCYIALARYIQPHIDQEKAFLATLKKEHTARRVALKESCKSRWERFAAQSVPQNTHNIKSGR